MSVALAILSVLGSAYAEPQQESTRLVGVRTSSFALP